MKYSVIGVLLSILVGLPLCNGFSVFHKHSYFHFPKSASFCHQLHKKHSHGTTIISHHLNFQNTQEASQKNNKGDHVHVHCATKEEDAVSSQSRSTSRVDFRALPRLFKNFLRLLTNALALNYRRLLWPGSLPDKSFDESLLPGKLGCPFIGVGSNLFSPFDIQKNSTTTTDAGTSGTNTAFVDFDQPRLGFVYAFFSPMAFVMGKKNVKQIVNSEFDEGGTEIVTFFENEKKLFGQDSVLLLKDKKEHSFVRRLVGSGMTPTSISKAIPQLQQIATEHVNNMVESSSSASEKTVIGEDIFSDFTIDVAAKIILGLDLNKEEQVTFKEELNKWFNGLLSVTTLLLPGLQFTKAWKARLFLIGIIEQKIAALKERGADGSTLSAMVFATDDDDDDGGSTSSKSGQKTLSHAQVIDNVLFLMLAGSETSSSTLTNCLLLLGLHPQIWTKVVQEQDELRKVYGDVLTKEQLDGGCPYLEAVIKETMRIKPISGGQFRRTKATMIVDGKQLPKGWPVAYNTRKTHLLDPSTRLEDGSHMDIMKGFNPERWLDDTTRPKDGDYMPFGSGPRYCLGASLAMAEMKIFLAIMARKVDFDLIGVDVDTMEWKKNEIIAIPKDGLIVSIRGKAD